jgi:hypothetical protein
MEYHIKIFKFHILRVISMRLLKGYFHSRNQYFPIFYMRYQVIQKLCRPAIFPYEKVSQKQLNIMKTKTYHGKMFENDCVARGRTNLYRKNMLDGITFESISIIFPHNHRQILSSDGTKSSFDQIGMHRYLNWGE